MIFQFRSYPLVTHAAVVVLVHMLFRNSSGWHNLNSWWLNIPPDSMCKKGGERKKTEQNREDIHTGISSKLNTVVY